MVAKSISMTLETPKLLEVLEKERLRERVGPGESWNLSILLKSDRPVRFAPPESTLAA